MPWDCRDPRYGQTVPHSTRLYLGSRPYPSVRSTCPAVPFSRRDNFHTEVLTFEIVDFLGAYLVILGRSCYAKFMAVLNYTYLKLKILGPQGIIIVGGDVHQTHLCEQENCDIAIAACQSAKPGKTQAATAKVRTLPPRGFELWPECGLIFFWLILHGQHLDMT